MAIFAPAVTSAARPMAGLQSAETQPSAGALPLPDNDIMHTLYDSDTFCVNHMLANAPEMAQANGDTGPTPVAGAPRAVPYMPRHGFEIIDKRSGKEIYLDGSWAELFQQKIMAWQASKPTQEEVEDTLEGYATLAHTPVAMH